MERVPLLTVDDVHVWAATLSSDDELFAKYEALLSATERAKADRYHNPRDRRRYVVGRGRLRTLLGEYLSQPPADVPLTATNLGKPFLGDPTSGVRFNVAHSADLALFAFARGREIGVDVEQVQSELNWRELAQRNFALEEFAALTSESATFDRREAFFRCWTRKEAYVKALGLGMQVPLDGFAVTIEPDSAALRNTRHDPGQKGRWQLHGLSPAAGFAAALAVEGHNWRLSRATHVSFP
jgi:4'-phosphopantetheinyl transferase